MTNPRIVPLRWPYGLLGLAALIAVLTLPLAASETATARLDARLKTIAAAPSAQMVRVIVRARPGARDSVRAALVEQGDRVLGELASINALTAVVRSDRLMQLAGHGDVASISFDALVSSQGGQLPGDPIGAVGGLLDGLVGVVTGVLDPATTTGGPAVTPQVLRDTLGIASAQTGAAWASPSSTPGSRCRPSSTAG